MRKFISCILSIFCVGCNSEKQSEEFVSDSNGNKEVASGVFLINEERNKYLNETPFNNAEDGMESENMFTDKFNSEIGEMMNLMSKYFEQHGEFGSLERYDKLPSDWWIGDDFHSTSRVLTVDLLNPKLQNLQIIRGVQERLKDFHNEWMILLTHDNDHDRYGRYVGKEGSYSIWVTKDKVEVFSERMKDIKTLLKSSRK